MSFIFLRADVTIAISRPVVPYTLFACGLYLEFAAPPVADNSGSLPDADPVVPDPLPGSLPDADPVVPDPLPTSAIIDTSGPTAIASNDLLAAPQSLVPMVPSTPVSPNALALATYATPPRPLSYVAIALRAVSLPSPSPSPGPTSPVATRLRPRRTSPPLVSTAYK